MANKPYRKYDIFPQDTEQFLITENHSSEIKAYFYKGQLTFDSDIGHFKASQDKYFIAKWDTKNSKWVEESSSNWDPLDVPHGEAAWSKFLYATETLDMVGLKSEPIEVYMVPGEAGEELGSELLDFSSLDGDLDYFILNNGDLDFKIKVDFNSLEVVVDPDSPLTLRSTAASYFFGAFNKNGYSGDPYVDSNFESYAPLSLIEGGSKELVSDGVVVIPKYNFVSSAAL